MFCSSEKYFTVFCPSFTMTAGSKLSLLIYCTANIDQNTEAILGPIEAMPTLKPLFFGKNDIIKKFKQSALIDIEDPINNIAKPTTSYLVTKQSYIKAMPHNTKDKTRPL